MNLHPLSRICVFLLGIGLTPLADAQDYRFFQPGTEQNWAIADWTVGSAANSGTAFPPGSLDTAVFDSVGIDAVLNQPTTIASLEIAEGDLEIQNTDDPFTPETEYALTSRNLLASHGYFLVTGAVDLSDESDGRLVLGFRQSSISAPIAGNAPSSPYAKMVIGNGGAIVTGGACHVGQHNLYQGHLRMTGNSRLDVADVLSAAIGKTSAGTIVLRSRGPDHSLQTRLYRHGIGDAVLQYEPNQAGFRIVEFREKAQLSGELYLTDYLYDVAGMASTTGGAEGGGSGLGGETQTHTLMEFIGDHPSSGSDGIQEVEHFFHRCRIAKPGVGEDETAKYDVDVVRDPDTDRPLVVLRRYDSALTEWSQWAEANFSYADRIRHADPDGDGLSNLGEFKLGQPPLHASDHYLKVVAVDNDDDGIPEGWWLYWSERTDRGLNVHAYPQVLHTRQVITDSPDNVFESFAHYWVADGFGQILNDIDSGGNGGDGSADPGTGNAGDDPETPIVDNDNIQERMVYYENTSGQTETPQFQLFFQQVHDDNQKPNIVLLVVDDLNDWVGCLGGHPEVQTPNIDRLARRGMLFSNAHSPGAICHVARAAILAGLRPDTSWVNDNKDKFREFFNVDNPRIEHPAHVTELETLPQYMKRNGYAIRATGKMYHGMARVKSNGSTDVIAESLDAWNDTWYINNDRSNGSYYKEWLKNGSQANFSYKPFEKKKGTPFHLSLGENSGNYDEQNQKWNYGSFDFGFWESFANADQLTSDEQIGRWAQSYLTEGVDPDVGDPAASAVEPFPANQPKFLTLGFFRPHLPWYVPERNYQWELDADGNSTGVLATVSEPDNSLSSNKSPSVKRLIARTPLSPSKSVDDDLMDAVDQGVTLRQSAVRSYLAAIQHTDEQIGRVLDGLDHRNEDRNTWVILISDHGFHVGEKRHWKKQTLWARSTHIPMIVVAPGVTQPGSVCDQPVSSLDIYKTLSARLGTSPTHTLDGCSLLPILQGQAGAVRGDNNQPEHVTTDFHRRALPAGTDDHTDDDPKRLWGHSVVSDQFRYIAYKFKRRTNAGQFVYEFVEELYDLTKPREKTTLLGWPTDPADTPSPTVLEMRSYLPDDFFDSEDHTEGN